MTKWLFDRGVDLLVRRHRIPDDLASITVTGSESGSSDAAEALWERVEALYRTGMHPGIQVCIRHDGEVVLDRAIGHARGVGPGRPFDPDRVQPMTLDTPVNLFSAAKAVTGMTMHKLEEIGALSLDDRVADHLPGFERHGKEEITLRQVLSHQAGIPSLPDEAFDLDQLTDLEWLESLICDLRPSGLTGGPPEYHAVVGGFVMELVARRADGRSLREVLDDEIRRPLGLSRLAYGVDPVDADQVAYNVETGFRLLGPLALAARRALGIGWEQALELSNDPRFLTAVIPSANVIVTAHDIAAFYQCVLNGGELDGTRVFEVDTVNRALEHQAEGTPFDRRLGIPMRYSPAFMLGDEQVSLYGYDHPRAFGHVGLSNLFTWADPDRDLVVALLTTGKPVLGTHLVALPQLIAEIHKTFPVRASTSGLERRDVVG